MSEPQEPTPTEQPENNTEQESLVQDDPPTPWDRVKDIDFGDRPTTGASDDAGDTPPTSTQPEATNDGEATTAEPPA
jgi:hypothetical protein